MGRPREFDRELALEHATRVFWAKGFAATSTEDLLQAMGIGRQSFYNAFGDKRTLYLEALEVYQNGTLRKHLGRLHSPASPAEGIADLLIGLIESDDELRALGCMGVGALCEFGGTDADVRALAERGSARLHAGLQSRIREGQEQGELAARIDPSEAASFIQMTMMGIQLGARGGADAGSLQAMARFAVERLKSQ
jgi:AcrR family transcriptional regulator